MVELDPTALSTAMLRDGLAVALRPLGEQDREALLAFGRALPQNELLYLEDDFQSPEIITRLINARFAENWRQLVAVADGTILGYAAARQQPGWSSHVADIRLLVGARWRRRGLGRLLAQAVFDAARDLRVDKAIVEMLEEQTAGQAIFERLGFRVEGTFSRHVRDRSGQRHNLIVMAYHMS